MKNAKLKEILLVAGEALFLAGITTLAVLPVSCKITEQGIRLVGGDYVPPVLKNFLVKDEQTLTLEFSEKVTVKGFVLSKVIDDKFNSEESSFTTQLSPALERASGIYGAVACSLVYDEEKEPQLLSFILEEEMEIGLGYELYLKVMDSVGNTLTLAIPFQGYNSRLAELMITEVQTESVSSQNKAEKEAGIYRNEYVEFLVLKGGNLSGLELCSGYDGEAKKYLFPPVEVETGQVFLVHMRNRGNGCISEEADDLALASASYTSPQIRDLWTDIESTTLGNKTDIIIVRNRADQRLLDALMYRSSSVLEWTKTMIDYSQLLDDSVIYESGGIENAFIADSLTSTKTLHRLDADFYRSAALANKLESFPIPSSAESWTIAEPSPGTL